MLRLENPGDDAAYPLVWNPNIDPSVMTPALKQEIQDNINKIKSGRNQGSGPTIGGPARQLLGVRNPGPGVPNADAEGRALGLHVDHR